MNSCGRETPVLNNIWIRSFLIALMVAVVPMQIAAQDRFASDLSEGQDEVGTSAFLAPPTGYTVIYHWIGVRSSAAIATAVHCTNLLGASTPFIVEFYDWDGVRKGFASTILSQHRTMTIATRDTAFFDEDFLVAPSNDLNQGVVRVLKKGTGRVVCMTQVLDALANPPTFVTTLPHFGPTGLH